MAPVPWRAPMLLLVLVVLLQATALASAQEPQPLPPDSGGGGGGGGGDAGGGGSGDAPTPPPDAPPPPPPPTPPPTPQQQQPTCDQLPTMPGTPRDRCDFFRAHCADLDEGAAFPYARAYWCGAALAPGPPPFAALCRWAYVALLVLACLPLLFALLGDTAERYFSPIMACVSQSIPKMRPRFAGVTFVALGNGAPDLSSNASAIRRGEYLLAAGAITGGAMFVQCVVGARVIAIASARGGAGGGRAGGGVRCAGAMARDAGVFSVAVLGLALALLSGSIGRGYVAWSVALYALYVAWVFAGDEWHAAGRPDTEQVRRSLLSLRERVGGALEAAAAAGGGGGGGFGFGSTGGAPPGRRRPPGAAMDDAGIDDEPALLLLLPPSAAGGNGAGGAGGAPWASAEGAPSPGLSSSAAAAPPPPAAPAARRGGSGGLSSGLLHPHHRTHHHQGGYVDPLTYRQLVWADLAGEEAAGEDGAAIEATALVREQRRRERRRGRRQQQQQQEAGGREQLGFGVTASRVRDEEAAGAGAYEPPKAEEGGGGGGAAGEGGGFAAWPSGGGQAGDDGLSPRRVPARAGANTAAQAHSADAAEGDDDQQPDQQQQHQQHQHQHQQQDFPPASLTALRRLLFGADAPPPRAAPPPLSGAAPALLLARLCAWLPEDWNARLYARARRAATHGASDEWDDPAATSPPQRLFRALTLPMLLSTYLAQRATIPLADPGPGYSRGWLLVSAVGFPLWMAAYLGAGGGGGGGAWVWSGALAVGLLSAWGLAVYTAGSPGTPPALPLPNGGGGLGGGDDYATLDGGGDGLENGGGGRGRGARASSCSSSASAASSLPPASPGAGPPWVRRAVPAALALAGFAAAAAWIDAVAGQAVSVLAFAAGLARLPQGVVGLTLLAWGNSLGDYFGNSALARAGAGSTAITACFAGPLFNVLISMALGFSARFAKLGRAAVAAAVAGGGGGVWGGGGDGAGGGAFAAAAAAATAAAASATPFSSPSEEPTDRVPVALTPEVALGCACLVLYSATAVAVGRACGGRLPPWFATVARLFYLAYFCGAVAWGMSSSSSSGAGAA